MHADPWIFLSRFCVFTIIPTQICCSQSNSKSGSKDVQNGHASLPKYVQFIMIYNRNAASPYNDGMFGSELP